MGQHKNVFGAMVEELNVIRFGVIDEVKVMVFFISLINNYQHLIIALESLKLEDWTWDDVCIRLLNEKLMQKEKGGISREITLFAQKQFDFKKVWEIGRFRCL